MIKVLSPLVSNMIAAGEVLERPASAVKELVENSIDAKADRIIIEIENAGKTLIRITDNGVGMTREDAKLCFRRHATSKIDSPNDLDGIKTLGFRGEALASIAAVSKVELITRRQDSIVGSRIILNAGETISVGDAGANTGTIISVRDLFYNTPARLKFMKQDATETAYITDIVEKMMMARPDISFKLIRNGKEALYTPGDYNMMSILTALYSADVAEDVRPIDYAEDGVTITGFVGGERTARANRKQQIFYVNKRPVRGKLFFAATDEAVQSRITSSKYPFVVLNIEMDSRLTDVNVHPAKTEIKFTDDRMIYNHIYRAINREFCIEGIDISKCSDSIAHKEEYEPLSLFSPKARTEEPLKLFESKYNDQYVAIKTEKFEALKPVKAEPVIEEKTPPPPQEYIKDYKIIGQLFNTYILIEREEFLYLLDQHAAHERLLYDKIKDDVKNQAIPLQQLLEPFVFHLTPKEHATVMENLELFQGLGFAFSDFGNNSLILRESPFSYDKKDIEDTITELIDIIYNNRKSLITYKQEKAIATIACKAAVKGNQSFSMREIERLVEDVLVKQEANTCPHGRPLFISFGKKEIEKQFKRIN